MTLVRMLPRAVSMPRATWCRHACILAWLHDCADAAWHCCQVFRLSCSPRGHCRGIEDRGRRAVGHVGQGQRRKDQADDQQAVRAHDQDAGRDVEKSLRRRLRRRHPGGGAWAHGHGICISLKSSTLHSKYTRALTCENLCQATSSDRARAKTQGRKPSVPKPDDFFADVDDAFASVKGKNAAKQAPGENDPQLGTPACASFDDDFDFPAPAKPVGSKRAGPSEAAGSNDPQRVVAEDGAAVEAAAVGDTSATEGWGDDSGGDGWGEDLDLDSLAKKLDISDAMAASDAAAAEAAAASAAAEEQVPAAGSVAGGASGAQECGATRLSKTADQVACLHDATSAQLAQEGGSADRPPDHVTSASQPTSASQVTSAPTAGEDGEADARVAGLGDEWQGFAMVGGGAGGAQLKGLEASLKGAVARLTRVTEEKEGLKVKVLELERTNVQMQEALARKGTQLQRAVEAQERLEVTVEEQRVKAEALQGELKTLNEANSHAAEMARYVKDLEKEKEDLFTDGKRVMEDKGVLEKTIKTLRQQLKDKDKDVESVKDGLMSEQARVKGFEERYVCMYACIYIYTYTHTHKFMAFFLLHKKIYM